VKQIFCLIVLIFGLVAIPNETWAQSPNQKGESWVIKRARDMVGQGQRLEAQGALQAALGKYLEAIGLDATNEQAYLKAGAVHQKLGNYHEAQRVYLAGQTYIVPFLEAQIALARMFRAQGLQLLARRTMLQAFEDGHQHTPALSELISWKVQDGAWLEALVLSRKLLLVFQQRQQIQDVSRLRKRVKALSLLASDLDPSQNHDGKRFRTRRTLTRILRRLAM
jgi:tetratricopeptide (TPR) repeat protein